MMLATRGFAGAVRVRRSMPIKAALEWAFSAEHAQLDLDGEAGQPGCDTIWRLMQRGALGCKVDGGGRSQAASDADIIASFVAALPIEHGGRGMAVQIAAMARAGGEPDWLQDVTPRIVPVGWRNTKHGLFAATEVVGQDVVTYRGRRVAYDRVVCPVTWSPSAQQISAARRHWLQWWGALLHLGHVLRVSGGLTAIDVTSQMPAMTPWVPGK